MTRSDSGARDSGRPLAQLVGVAQDGLHLVQQELRLARQETLEKLTPTVRSTAMIFAGGLCAILGSVYLLQAIVRAFATRMPHWLASLVFGAGLTAGGIVLVRRGGTQLKNIDIVPEKTINSLREDKEWLLHQIRSKLT